MPDLPPLVRVSARELKGRRVSIIVHRPPCIVRMDGTVPLTASAVGTVERFIRMPGGAIGIIITDAGERVAFDAGLDIKAGKITIEVPGDG